MEEKINLYQKLAKARVMLNAKEMKKSGYNNFSKYHYYELQDFIPKVNEIFEEVGLIGIFNLDEKKAKLTIIDTDRPEITQVFYTPTAEADIKGAQAIQKLGGVHTYLKRYLYQNALEITENDAIDPLSQEKNNKQQQKTEKKELTENEKLKGFIVKNKLDITKVATRFNLSKETKEEDYQKALASLQELDNVSLQEFTKGN